MNITTYIKEIGHLELCDEESNILFNMFNTGGVECEVGEFLHAITKIFKPAKILETGTHYGISTAYFAIALKENGNGGHIVTIDGNSYSERTELFKLLEVESYITELIINCNDFVTDDIFDIILLDTEPCLRFDEFDRYYRNLKDGGIIIIHDLHPHLSYNPDTTVNDTYHWPFGDFRDKLGKYIKNHNVQVMSFPTPRGCTIFQKPSSNMSYIKYINGEL